MIIGIGSDLIDIRRIEKTLTRFGKKFEDRIFTVTELAKAESRSKGGECNKAATLAKRFAAKEACSKALGTGLNQGVFWKDMAVSNLASGKPTLLLTGGAAKHLQKMTPEGMKVQIDLTMTDEYPLAQALVIISAS
jgi:holo-[acyl-carrier protein] synthase